MINVFCSSYIRKKGLLNYNNNNEWIKKTMTKINFFIDSREDNYFAGTYDPLF